MAGDGNGEDPKVRVSSLETLKTPSIRTVQLEFFDDHDCVSFQHWWETEGQRVYDAWKKSR